MRRMAAGAAEQRAAEEARRAAEWRDEEATPLAHPDACADCHHDWHAWWNGYWIAHECFDEGCLCGVAACASCGARHRAWTYDDAARWPTRTCGACGATEYLMAYA